MLSNKFNHGNILLVSCISLSHLPCISHTNELTFFRQIKYLLEIIGVNQSIVLNEQRSPRAMFTFLEFLAPSLQQKCARDVYIWSVRTEMKGKCCSDDSAGINRRICWPRTSLELSTVKGFRKSSCPCRGFLRVALEESPFGREERNRSHKLEAR